MPAVPKCDRWKKEDHGFQASPDSMRPTLRPEQQRQGEITAQRSHMHSRLMGDGPGALLGWAVQSYVILTQAKVI